MRGSKEVRVDPPDLRHPRAIPYLFDEKAGQ
jgi:hypothetical protein